MITFTKFNAIKILLQGGAGVDEICQTLAVTEFTVVLVQKCEDYDQYKKECNSLKYLARKQKEANRQTKKQEPQTPPTQVIEHRQSVTLVANQYMAQELQKQTRFLELISNKLAFIVDELVGTEKGMDKK